MASKNSNECPTCGNTNYDLSDGLYYCTLCQTQSQHAVEIDYSETLGDFVIPSQSLQIAEKTKKQDKTEAVLSSYALYEAYAIIFERLAKSLIRLGLPETIKEALFRLYALYLRHRNVAFADKDNVQPDVSTPSTPFRSKLLNVGKRNKHKGRKSVVKMELDQVLSTNEANLDESATDYFADFFGFTNAEPTKESSSPSKRMSQNAESAIAVISSDEEGHVEDEFDEYAENINYATRIKPDLLIPFCYLACLAVAPQQVCISDLIRWAKENLLPIVNAHKLLPDRLTHSLIKHHFIKLRWAHRSNCASVLYRRSLWLAKYIGYATTIDFDADVLLARFAYDLNLTKHLLPRARAVFHYAEFIHDSFRFCPSDDDENLRQRNSPATPPEVAAVAILIVALKLTFGLDDHCEYIISQLADEHSRKDDTKNQFSFCRWQLQCKLRTAIMQGESIENVLNRFWIDQRDTWMHGLSKELAYTTESNIRSDKLTSRSTANVYDNQEDQENDFSKEKTEFDLDVEGLRQFFDKFTPFKPSTGPVPMENRRFLYPIRETADQLKIDFGKSIDQKDFDKNNVKIFEHDYFNDSLSFLEDDEVKKRIRESINKLIKETDEEIDESINEEIDTIFPCAEVSAQMGKFLVDDGVDQNLLIANMMENEDEYELSTNLTWLLKLCKNRLQESMWVLFRAVQRIEMSLDY